MSNPHEHVCPRGHHMVVEADDHAKPYRCIECDHRGYWWDGDPYYSDDEVRPVTREPIAVNANVPNCVAEVAHRLNVHAPTLPFDKWQYDRAEIGQAMYDHLNSLHPTQREFKLRDMAHRLVDETVIKQIGVVDMNHSCSDRLWASHKVQPISGDYRPQIVYLNPEYVHYEACGPSFDLPDAKKRYWTMLYATLGRIEPRIVERNLGIGDVTEYDPHWETRRRWGRVWLANTLKVYTEWKGLGVTELGRIFGMHHNMVRRYLDDHAQLEYVPPDPSFHHRFSETDRSLSDPWDSVGGEVA